MRIIRCLFFLLICSFVCGCSANNVDKSLDKSTEFTYQNNDNMFFLTDVIPSSSLKNNRLGDPEEQNTRVFLPSSYYKTQKRYPVVYYLHGYGSSYLEVDWYKDAYKTYMSNTNNKEFILVGLNGRNKLEGSFYANSPVTGNWEDYVVKDAINFIDSKYQTISNPQSRGICGFSMGGLGTINIAFKYPQVYSCMFAISPGIFDEKDMERILKTWSPKMVSAYGAAFAPNPANEYPYMDIPKFNTTTEDMKIQSKWISGAGNLDSKVSNNLNSIQKLSGIQIEYGTKDLYDWIPGGCRKLSKSLNDRNIKNQLIEFEGNHGDKNHVVVERDMFPFFSKILE